MSRKKQRKSKRTDLKRVIKTSEKRHWKVIIDSQEASVNFYSLLSALQKEKGSNLVNIKALRYVTRWINGNKNWLIMETGELSEHPFDERFEEGFSPFSHVVHKFKEGQIQGELFLRDPSVGSQPGTE